MDSEVFFNDNFSENSEKSGSDETFIKKINFSWIRILICFFIFIGLLFCHHFYPSYYEKIGTFYSINFKNDDEKISEIKNSMSDKLAALRGEIKEKLNHL